MYQWVPGEAHGPSTRVELFIPFYQLKTYWSSTFTKPFGFCSSLGPYWSSTFSTTLTWSPRTVMGMGTTDS